MTNQTKQKITEKESQPQEGWERRLREILIGEVWATNNFSSPEEAIKELVRQEKAASRKEGYSAALDEAIEVYLNNQHLESGEIISALNAMKGKGLNAKE